MLTPWAGSRIQPSHNDQKGTDYFIPCSISLSRFFFIYFIYLICYSLHLHSFCWKKTVLHCLCYFCQGVTESFGAAVSCLSTAHLTDEVIRRSKRMILDTLGVGLLGSSTPVFNTVFQYSQVRFMLFCWCMKSFQCISQNYWWRKIYIH